MKEEKIICPYCHKEAEWVENKEIYGKNYGNSYMIWLCRTCKSYVGCHQNTKTPLGTIANTETREARKRVHAVIDPLWKQSPRRYKRKTVYIRLKEAFGKEIHVGESDIQQCEDIIKTASLIFQK